MPTSTTRDMEDTLKEKLVSSRHYSDVSQGPVVSLAQTSVSGE